MSDSVNDLLVEVAIRESNDPDSRLLIVPTTDFFSGFDCKYGMNQSWSGNLTLFDYEGAFLETLLLQGSLAGRNLQIRWGWISDSGEGIAGYAPTFFGKVVKPKPKFTPDGITLDLELVQDKAVVAALDKKVRFVPGDFKASDLVKTVARERGWKTTDRRGRETIQTNDVAHFYGDALIGYTDEELLAYWADRTVDPQGNLFRFGHDPDGIVFFHTDNFLTEEVAKHYIFGRDTMGEVESFEPEEANILSALHGAAKVKFAATASKEKVSESRTADQGQAPPGGKLTAVNDAAYEPDIGDGVASRVPVIGRDSGENEREMQARRYAARSAQIQATMKVHGTHAVSPMDRVRVDYYLRTGDLHFLSGVYQVMAIEHDVGVSGWGTTFTLYRAANQYTPDAKKVSADKTLTVPSTKPGAGTASALRAQDQTGRQRSRVRDA